MTSRDGAMQPSISDTRQLDSTLKTEILIMMCSALTVQLSYDLTALQLVIHMSSLKPTRNR